MTSVTLHALPGLPLVEAGEDLASRILSAAARDGLDIRDGDILVVAQKIISKAKGRLVSLSSVVTSPEAERLASLVAKDPRIVELVLADTETVMRAKAGVLIVRNRHGIVLANGGVDQSNVDHAGGKAALLLPVDPDQSAARLRQELVAKTGAQVAVVIVDSLGRAWRIGTTGTAIGAAGIPALLDLRGRPDIFGRELATTELGLADEIAAAGSLLMGQAAEGTPVVLIRGLHLPQSEGCAADLVRPKQMDLFP